MSTQISSCVRDVNSSYLKYQGIYKSQVEFWELNNMFNKFNMTI